MASSVDFDNDPTGAALQGWDREAAAAVYGSGGGGGGGGGGAGQETHDPADIVLQVLNGTDVSGLAADTQAMLKEEGYRVPTATDAQNKPVERTEIAYKRAYKADAGVLRDQFFADAQLVVAAPDADADITVTLGVDYAESAEA
jgi:hypothetical protein